ncbi:MAG: serine hydrolase, partial [Candidatus Aminicenantes bacterium]|nr:serine hydrolase [Candidatus Aminicenantes bacterium]
MKKASNNFIVFLWIVLMIIPISLMSDEVLSLKGHWEGIIDIPAMKLDINIDFSQKEDGSWEGDISIPAQKAKDLPLGNICLAEKEVTFEITGIPGNPTFKGTLSDDGSKIAGDFSQEGKT